jgi:hypothetical protein
MTLGKWIQMFGTILVKKVKNKSKAMPVRAMNAGGIVPLFHNHGTGWMRVVNFIPWSLYP